jgi:hypothetical protein
MGVESRTRPRRRPLVGVGVGRVVAQPRILRQRGRGADPEPVDAAAQPEPQHIGHGRAHLRVAPVEVRRLVAFEMLGERLRIPGNVTT